MGATAPEALLVTTQWHGDVVLLTLNRPEARNALSRRVAHDFLAALRICAGARALVVTGADPAFCAGADLKELATRGPTRLGVAAGLRSCGIPSIAAVNGACLTGGLELAVAADIIIASERAFFADTHAQVNVYPGGGMNIRLPFFVGPAFANYLSLTGERIDARTALRAGLVAEITPHADLVSSALRLAAQIALGQPAMVGQTLMSIDASSKLPAVEAWQLEDETATRLHVARSQDTEVQPAG